MQIAIRARVKNLLSRFPRLDGNFRRYIWSRIHFPEAEMRFLASLPIGSIDIAVDVGAALGSYSWILSRKSRNVFAFEPGVHHSKYLANLVAGSNVTLVRAAVGAASGSVSIYTPGSDENARHSATLSLGNPAVHMPGTVSEQVALVSLDEFFQGKIDHGHSLDLVKVDIEGYELEALKGSVSLIAIHHPLVICEIEKRHNSECHLVFELLRNLGYVCFIYRGGNFLPFDDSCIDSLQTDAALKYRIGKSFTPRKNAYINNFVFQHPLSKVKVAQT